jgi:hypothetical protein
MPQVATKIEEYESLAGKVGGHSVTVVTYRLGGRYVCIIENQEVGATVCRVCGETKTDVLSAGLSEAERLMQPVTHAPAMVRGASAAYIDRIVMQIKGEPVAFTIMEFLSLPMGDRMKLIFAGKLSFLDSKGGPIPVGHAIELLRRVTQNVKSNPAPKKEPGLSPVLEL